MPCRWSLGETHSGFSSQRLLAASVSGNVKSRPWTERTSFFAQACFASCAEVTTSSPTQHGMFTRLRIAEKDGSSLKALLMVFVRFKSFVNIDCLRTPHIFHTSILTLILSRTASPKLWTTGMSVLSKQRKYKKDICHRCCHPVCVSTAVSQVEVRCIVGLTNRVGIWWRLSRVWVTVVLNLFQLYLTDKTTKKRFPMFSLIKVVVFYNGCNVSIVVRSSKLIKTFAKFH